VSKIFPNIPHRIGADLKHLFFYLMMNVGFYANDIDKNLKILNFSLGPTPNNFYRYCLTFK
jgi:hypothetical protein